MNGPHSWQSSGECGKRKPTKRQVKKLASFFGVSP
jgi:hypothetical protein